MSEPCPGLVLIGGGEHARVVVDAARLSNWTIVGYVDRAPNARTERLGISYLGDDDAFAPPSKGPLHYVITVGNIGPSPVRREIARRYQAKYAESLLWASVVHASATVSPSAKLEDGVVVLAGAIVNAGAVLGAHAIINTGVIVEHDVALGALVHVSPGAVIGGGVEIGAGSYLGLGCKIRDHVRIGAGVTIGMGAVVVSDVPDGVTVKGVPGRWR